ncbi:head-tail joining protein [Roseibium aggregatum]|uniref:head-tail joining protein n=1 Tax=Roseibium aggregatum TaxID=187304 RepID=UPI001E643F71|nr:hypothetical protein [Roseibium aggregatum]UES51575.1 hypothetical protein GFK88_19325 [Roseibium aggregatum]
MPVETAADRASMFNPDEFGVTAQYVLQGGSPEDVDGQFLNEDEVMPFGDVGLSSASPEFHCAAVDLPAGADEGDTLILPAGSYRVAAPIRCDGEGMAVLTLSES